MKLLSVSKTIQATNYTDNIQNYKTWTGMSQYFDEIFLIVESPDKKWHHQKCEKLDITWVPKYPKLIENIYYIFTSYRYCKKLVKENQIDVLNVGEPICAGLMAVRLKAVVKRPLVVQLQGQFFNLPDDYPWLQRMLIKGITKYVSCKADRIRAVSNEIRKEAIKNGIDESKIFVSPSRCDTELFCAEKYQNAKKHIKEELKYKPDDIILIFTGRLIHVKDVDSILDALVLIVAKHQNVRLLIIGDGPLRDSLQEKTKRLGLWDHVIFYGLVAYDKIPEMLAVGDIFVSPSLDEGLPRAVLEAMSMGLATVVTPVGGNPEIIQNNENGYFVGVKSPEQIADKINYLIEHPKILAEIRQNARKRIVECYEYNKCIKSFAEIHFGIME